MTTKATQFVPTEEQILKELKQKEQRKTYMKSPKAAANRKTYQQKRQEERKVLTAAIKDMEKNEPEKYAALMKKAGINK